MRIGLGAVNLGSASSTTSIREQVRLVTAAIECGFSVIDTSNAYGAGASERVIGAALRGRRDRVTLATKGGYVVRERGVIQQRARRHVGRLARRLGTRGTPASSGPQRGRSPYAAQDFSIEHLRRSIESSLRRLRTDHIDVFQLHGPGPADLDAIAALLELRSEGKIGRIGVGCESVEVARLAARTSGVEVVQLPFGVLDADSVSRVRAGHAMPVELWARGVLGGGVIAAAMHDPGALDGHPKWALIEAIRSCASEAGIAVDELAVRWVLDRRDVDVTLLGISTFRHLERNRALVSAPPLPADVRDRLDRILGSWEPTS